jgi:Holliday junction resolvasome RuvABC DNA-binding subunit
MLRALSGTIVDTWDEGVVLRRPDGVELELHMAHHQSMQLMEQYLHDSGIQLIVPVHLEVSQAPSAISFELVGFCDAPSRQLYGALRRIQGIGRRSALAALETGSYRDTLRAVAAGDVRWLTGLPGIGQARAETIIKLLRREYGKALPQPLSVGLATWIDARDQLVNTGMANVDEAEETLRRQLLDGGTLT